MRKYDSKNKRNIGIIVVICLIFAIIFSYFLIKEINLSKIKYTLDTGSILFDNDKNSILLNSAGIIKKKWNKNYYLTYNEEKYKLGSHVISYNNSEVSLTLYGEFYEVNASSEVNITSEETKLNNLGISRFYKLADRKYLVVDLAIKTSDELLKTKNYLIIELDKQGNAILYNNDVNVKSFSETKIITSLYTFDIANELLIYEDNTIDLKEILGTTNEYKKDDKDTTNNGTKDDDNTNLGNDSNTGNNNGNGGTTNGNGTGNNQNGNNNVGNNNANTNTNQSGVTTIEPGTDKSENEIINETSYTSIIKITPSINNILVDYVVYDKLNEYLSVFVEIRSNEGVKTVYLSKATTSVNINNLLPNTTYELTFKYTHLSDTLVKEEVIDKHTVTTKFPEVSLSLTKTTSKNIYYNITSSYQIDSAVLRLYINNEKQSIELPINSSNLSGSINISNLSIKNNSIVTLQLENITISSVKSDKIVSYSYKVENGLKEDNDNSNIIVTPSDDQTEVNNG